MNYELRLNKDTISHLNKIKEMRKDNIVQLKSYAFAVRIIKVYQFLCNDRKEFVLSKQFLLPVPPLVRIEEAIGRQSGKDFYAKRSISHKEARETHY